MWGLDVGWGPKMGWELTSGSAGVKRPRVCVKKRCEEEASCRTAGDGGG